MVMLTLACKHEPGLAPGVAGDGNFPDTIGNIFVNRCATAGCHNAASHTGAGGLRLDTWAHLFDGGNNGAVVVPYSSDYSSLMYFINTDPSLGPVAVPTMPLNHEPLTPDEYLAIKRWIDNGAPDKNGNIPFATEPATRQKIYAVHRGCDMMAVIDVAKNVVMRYVPIGNKPGPESAIYTRVSPDGRYAYASFWYTNEVYKIDANTDRVAAVFKLDNYFWSTMNISADGRYLVLPNGDDHELALVNTDNGTVQRIKDAGFVNPHGIAANAAFDTFYITSLHGNVLYRYNNGRTDTITVNDAPATTVQGSPTPDPYEIIMSPDGSRYFISCAGTNEVRVFSRHNDSLLKVISVGTMPRGLAVSRNKPYLFISCMEDEATGIFKGSVHVIDYNTLNTVHVIKGSMYQPHSVAVNDGNSTFYIFSRNQNFNGPAPHHSGPCDGRNGYYQVYDMNTLQPLNNKRYEVLVEPYVAAPRF